MIMNPIWKKRILLRGKLHLADLLYFSDARNRYHFKCSFKNKVSPLRTWKKHFGELETLDFKNPHTTKSVKDGQSLEVSFKFQDCKLEIKREVKGGSIERSFYKVIVPTERNLFTVIINNQEGLNQVSPTENDMVVLDKNLKDQIALVFSFVSAKGKPIMDPIINTSVGKQFILSFPDQSTEFDKIYLAIVKFDKFIPNLSDCLIAIPYDAIKN